MRRISHTFRQVTLICLFVMLPSCADKPEDKPKEKEEDSNAPKLVGRVASIPADRRFVLIQAYGTWTVETGSVLTTQGPGERAANLRATGERLGQYAAADIQSGTLEVGDGVYTIATPPKVTPTEPEETENPGVEEKPQPEPTKTPAAEPESTPLPGILAPD